LAVEIGMYQIRKFACQPTIRKFLTQWSSFM